GDVLCIHLHRIRNERRVEMNHAFYDSGSGGNRATAAGKKPDTASSIVPAKQTFSNFIFPSEKHPRPLSRVISRRPYNLSHSAVARGSNRMRMMFPAR